MVICQQEFQTKMKGLFLKINFSTMNREDIIVSNGAIMKCFTNAELSI